MSGSMEQLTIQSNGKDNHSHFSIKGNGLIMDKSMEAQNLTSILCAYKELSANPLCEKIIRESGLCVPSLMKYGEYLFIPLQLESYPSSSNRFGVYSLRFQQPDIIDTVVLQTEAYAYTILHNIICNDQNQESNQSCLNMWGCLKNNYTDAPIDQKLMYLYSSMISTRIIRTNSSLMRDAFLLTVWDFSYRIIIQQNNTYIETVNDAISSLKANGNNPRYSHLLAEMQAKDFDVDHFDQQFAIKLLYEMFDYDRNSIISFISGDTVMHIRILPKLLILLLKAANNAPISIAYCIGKTDQGSISIPLIP